MADLPDWIDRPASEHMAGMTLNRPGADDWALALGKVILNFGVIEAMTYWWIGELAPGHGHIDSAQGLNFGKRVAALRKLIKGWQVPAAIRKSALDGWSRAERLSKTRNDLAHNPTISWRAADDAGPPDTTGIVVYKKLTIGEPPRVITLEQVLQALNQSNEVITLLYDTLADRSRK